MFKDRSDKKGRVLCSLSDEERESLKKTMKSMNSSLERYNVEHINNIHNIDKVCGSIIDNRETVDQSHKEYLDDKDSLDLKIKKSLSDIDNGIIQRLGDAIGYYRQNIFIAGFIIGSGFTGYYLWTRVSGGFVRNLIGGGVSTAQGILPNPTSLIVNVNAIPPVQPHIPDGIEVGAIIANPFGGVLTIMKAVPVILGASLTTFLTIILTRGKKSS